MEEEQYAPAVTRCPCECKSLPKFTPEEVALVTRWIKLYDPENPENINLHDVEEGMNHELEHCDVTGGDPIQTARIALAHLREDPEYYEKLKKAGL